MNSQTFSKSPVRRPSGSAAFTLIELLVVIAIIAVLAGLLLPVTASVMRNARKVSAKNTEMQLVAAVGQYYTEYSQYPIPVVGDASTTPQDYTYTVDGQNNNGEVMDVLRAINKYDANGSDPTSKLNSKRISYFEAKNVKSASTPKDGFILTGNPTGNNGTKLKVGDLVDPWGNLYGIRMDGNYSNAVKNPYESDSKTSTDDTANQNGGTDQTVLRTGVVAYCYGEDGKVGDKGNKGTLPYSPTPGDDVVSWQ